MPIKSFNVFKKLFSLYFAIAWLSVLPFSDMTFNRLNQVSQNPSWWWSWLASHGLTSFGIMSLVVASLGLMFKETIRFSSLYLLVNWIILYQFMPFIFFPPNGTFIGWILLWLVFYPHELSSSQRQGWWFILTLGYLVSGLAKIDSSVWQNGLAVDYLIKSPVGGNSTLFLINYPFISKILTYMTLALELGGVFLCFSRLGKKVLWYSFLIMHLIISACLNIPEIGLFFLIFNIALLDKDISSDFE